MSLYGIMRTSASGMAAQGDRLGAVADNIANASTTGYKRSALEFSTMVLDPGIKSYESGSVEPAVRHLISEQGGFSYTKSVTDIGIKGNGFFVVQDAGGQTFMTRAGSFVKDQAGNLVNAGGFTLLGYPASASATPSAANSTDGLVPVNVSPTALVASPSTTGSLIVNLPSNAAAAAAADLPSANAATAAPTAKTSLTAYDNLGNTVMLDVYFTKSAANTWDVAVFDQATATSGGFPYTSGPLTTSTLNFDPSTGALASSGVLSIPVPNGAAMTLDLAQSSQLAADYMVREANVDGNEPSAVARVEIAKDGTVYSIYENGARQATYRIPLADVASSDNMVPLAGNVYQPTKESGVMRIGLPSQSGLGTLISSALEKSTVDIASELTVLIEAEKHYTANSKVFQTGADLMDVLVNLKR